MTNSNALFGRIVPAGLLVTVVIEMLVPLMHTPGALTRSHPLAGAGLAAGGIFSVIQLGIGLSAFRPLLDGGEHFAPVFDALWRTAFFLYFAGKVAIGAAALAYGAHLWRSRPRP